MYNSIILNSLNQTLSILQNKLQFKYIVDESKPIKKTCLDIKYYTNASGW